MTTNELEVIRRRNLWMLRGLAPNLSTLSEQLGIPDHEIGRYGRGQQIHNYTARKIETKLDKPYGWMDRPNYAMDLTMEEWELIENKRRCESARKRFLVSILAKAGDQLFPGVLKAI